MFKNSGSLTEYVASLDTSTATTLNANEHQEHQEQELEWKPGRAEYAVMATISVISLMVALDATILVPVLPVGGCLFFRSAIFFRL